VRHKLGVDSIVAQGDVIRDHQLVCTLLRRVSEQRALLRVTLPDSRVTYHSAILRLEPDDGYLVLDELNPRQGHERLLVERRLHASAMVQGAEIRFGAELQAVGEQEAIAFYRVRLPDELVYLQRRASFRVHVPLSAPLAASFQWEEDDPLRGRVTDLSEGGVGVEFSCHVQLAPGEILPCELHLPDGERLACDLEVRYAKAEESPQRMRMGGRFLELPPQQRKALARLVADLQRELIRKGPRSG